jgi:class 3 adenylate cyclase/tetratricopeptide (TPR) repeat protein
MLCAKCGAENPAGKRFCGDCGATLANRCGKCGAESPPEKKFCGDCGSALGTAVAAAVAPSSPPRAAPKIRVTSEQPDASATLDGERKTVTALFADIKGSMDLIEDLDPEEARAIVDPALKLMIDAAHRYDGYIVQSTGDGIFAIFGAPVAHEDHPQRALHAALRMQEDLKRYADKLREQGQPPLLVRVGVNTGEVVVRSIRTGDAHTEYTPIGHSMSLASRLQTLAAPGSVVIGQSVQKFVEGYFQLKALGASRIKGVSEPVNVYEVTGLGPLRTRLQRSAGRGYTKFVGREREIETLKHIAGLAREGHGQIAGAVAEAGTGKSRLFFEFKAISQSGWMVLEAYSVSHGKASAYLPVIELLHGYFAIEAGDDARKRREKVTGRVLALERTLEDTLPYLFALLGVEEGTDLLAQMDAQVRRRRTLDAIKRILLRESLNQPLMVIFEDLHWIDEQTQALLTLLADSIGTAKLLLLVNYRPEYSHQWNSKTYYTQLRLDPLGKESAAEMLTALIGDAIEVRPLKRLIIERTGGNPFFMEETVQVLLDEGALVRDGAAFRITKSLSELKIPPTVQAILAARIDRLPAREKDLLQAMAVIGKEFPVALVREVIKQPHDEINRMLNELQLAEFIYEQPAAGDLEYTFKHALTQQVAYNSVLVERRRLLHRTIGAAIESLYRDRLEDHYVDLAHHYSLSDDAAKAVEYLRLAAEQAVARSAYSEAAADLQAALALLDRLPEGSERARTELTLRITENTVALVLYGVSSLQHEQATQRLCDLADQLEENGLLLRGLVGLASIYFTHGEPLRALATGRRCLELAEPAPDGAALAYAAFEMACGAHAAGLLGEAASRYAEAMLHAEQANHRDLILPFATWSSAAIQRSNVLASMGRVTEAAKLAEEGLRYARESRHLFSLGLALTAKPRTHCFLREPEIALMHAEEAIALSDEHGFAEWIPWGRFNRGWALAALGRVADGVAEMAEGIAGFERLGGVPWQRFSIALLAHGHARLGRHSEALDTIDKALEHVERSGEFDGQAEMLRLKGEILLMDGKTLIGGEPKDNKPLMDGNRNVIAAEQCFRAALEVARAQEARWWQLRATLSLARLLRDTGRREEGLTMLAEIYGWFTEGFDTADLKDAKALLDQLGA